MFFVSIFLSLLGLTVSSDSLTSSLSFGSTTSDYVSFWFNMSPFSRAFSVCSFIKNSENSGSHPVLLNYKAESSPGVDLEILIGSKGHFNRVFNDAGLENINSRFPQTSGIWFHYCLTWSRTTRMQKVYINGALVGEDSTEDRDLYSTGTLYMGNLYVLHSAYVFGGEIHQFNIYSKVLSAAEVKITAETGVCGLVKQFEENRLLRWEEIVKKTSAGNVALGSLDQPACIWAKKYTSLSQKLRDTENQLNVTKASLQTTTSLLNTCNTKLANARQYDNITKWDVLYTTEIFNKILTQETLAELSSSWNQLENFIGQNITEGVVNHFIEHDTGPECSPLDVEMLRDFQGAELTEGLVDHFEESHSDCTETEED